MADAAVRLRPFRETDLDMLYRDATDPDYSLPFQWSGFRSTASIRRRWEKDNFLDDDPRQLVIAGTADDAPLGFVVWSNYEMFGRAAAPTLTIGIILSPEHRGRGVGTAAQRLLADHLFATTQVHRLVANTELDNIAEQRASKRVASSARASCAKSASATGAGVTPCTTPGFAPTHHRPDRPAGEMSSRLSAK